MIYEDESAGSAWLGYVVATVRWSLQLSDLLRLSLESSASHLSLDILDMPLELS